MHFSQPEFFSGHETEEIPGGFIAQHPKISDTMLWAMFPALPVLLQCPVKQPMNLLSCPNCAELWRLAMLLGTGETPHWRPCGLRRGWMTFGGCRQAGALPSHTGRKEKRRRAGSCLRWEREQHTSGCSVSKCQQSCIRHLGIQILVLAARIHAGCSSARLWVQGQEFTSLFAGRKYGRHMSAT